MKILMVGSGAVGGFLGSRFIERDLDVTFVTHPERKAYLLTRGLSVLSPYGRFRRPAFAVTPDDLGDSYDLAIVAVRAHIFDQAMGLISRRVCGDTIVISVVEGVAPFDLLGSNLPGRHVIGVFEGRLFMDADGVIHQRMPKAELNLGALSGIDVADMERLASRIGGRGLSAFVGDRIGAAAWERFGYLVAGIGTSVMTGLPLRDALRFHFGPTMFSGLLDECIRVGRAAGFAPDELRARAYRMSFMLEGRPVAAPNFIPDGGRAADEATYLLAEMTALAKRAGIAAHRLAAAWRKLAKADEIEGCVLAVEDDQI